jgi:hypothetical protein
LTGVIEAGQDTKLGDSDHGRYDLEALKCHQGVNRRFEPPGGEKIRHGCFAPSHAIACV